ncbi:hypothetical protein [Nostoc sp. MG11]|uniref:hypothetical protein n=1 Tax=Nostoc sp. MG11 TaxID=2721166 RepID=UPI0018662C10|nr:hypothetical protein [Nostoc sp. MG11]
MDFLKVIELIVVIFLATCLFCWLFTSYWFFGPIMTVVYFLGGLLLISVIGVLIIHEE